MTSTTKVYSTSFDWLLQYDLLVAQEATQEELQYFIDNTTYQEDM